MEDNLVDALEGGRIVRVSPEYARREGLLILKKAPDYTNPKTTQQSLRIPIREIIPRVFRKSERVDLDKYRKPMHSDLLAELKPNFHWEILRMRKDRGLTRKRVAEILNVKEEDLKAVENGILPYRDYVIIGKLEQFYKISLRRDGKDFQGVTAKKEEHKEEEKKEDDFGIEIVD